MKITIKEFFGNLFDEASLILLPDLKIYLISNFLYTLFLFLINILQERKNLIIFFLLFKKLFYSIIMEH